MRIIMAFIVFTISMAANATSSSPLGEVSFSTKVLTVTESGKVEAIKLGEIGFNTTILVRSQCMEFDGNNNIFVEKPCLVKRPLGETSFNDEIVVE